MSDNETNLAPPQSVLIAISSKEIARKISEVLSTDYGIAASSTCRDGDSAWLALQPGKIDFVIVEWKSEKIPGLVLFNRLRLDPRYLNVPVLVVSPLTQKENFVLLNDYPPTGVVNGEFSEISFSAKFRLLWKEAAAYKATAKAISAIAAKAKTEPTVARSELAALAKASADPLRLYIMAARMFRGDELHDEAEVCLREALKLDAKSTAALMDLAKIYLATDRNNQAKEVLIGNKFSIKNVERQLLLGEVELAEKNSEEAKRAFSSALALDPASDVATKGILVADNLKKFIAENDPAEVASQSFTSIMNSVAIVMIKAGLQEEAVKHYKAVLAFARSAEIQGRVMYNLGLAYAKFQKKNDAIEWFNKALEVSGDKLPAAAEQIKRLKSMPDVPPEKAAAVEKKAAPKA